jgi:hypothetical protein
MAIDFGNEAFRESSYFPATLVGCAVYKSTFTEVQHQTGFIFDLKKRDTANSHMPALFDLASGRCPPAVSGSRQHFQAWPQIDTA